jgi:hypothetical protein
MLQQHAAVAIGIGIGATMVMDLWNIFLRRAFGIPSLDYGLLGRWVSHMPGGTFRHASISAASPKPRERAVGWVTHYAIGMALALTFVMLAGGWIEHPTLLPALLFGLGTALMPFLVLQPSLGLGVASSRAKNPAMARLKSLATHTVFGAGLYLFALLLT